MPLHKALRQYADLPAWLNAIHFLWLAEVAEALEEHLEVILRKQVPKFHISGSSLRLSSFTKGQPEKIGLHKGFKNSYSSSCETRGCLWPWSFVRSVTSVLPRPEQMFTLRVPVTMEKPGEHTGRNICRSKGKASPHISSSYSYTNQEFASSRPFNQWALLGSAEITLSADKWKLLTQCKHLVKGKPKRQSMESSSPCWLSSAWCTRDGNVAARAGSWRADPAMTCFWGPFPCSTVPWQHFLQENQIFAEC